MIDRSCGSPEYLKEEVKNFFKDQLGVEDNIDLYLHKVPNLGVAKSNCQNTGNFFSPKVINTTNKKFEPEYKFVKNGSRVYIQNMYNSEVFENGDFCVDDDAYGNVVARACTLPCLGRKPCLRSVLYNWFSLGVPICT